MHSKEKKMHSFPLCYEHFEKFAQIPVEEEVLSEKKRNRAKHIQNSLCEKKETWQEMRFHRS